MRISIVASNIEFDAKGFITATFKSLREQMLRASAEFVHAALDNNRVPIDTGMARGSFLNMLQLLDTNSGGELGNLGDRARSIPKGVPTTAQRRNRDGTYIKYYHSDGTRHKKRPETAKQFSTTRGQIIKRDGDKLTFNYQIDVVHFNVMDEFNPYGESWHSIRRGREAFMNTMKDYKPPHVTKYLLVSTQGKVNRGTDDDPVVGKFRNQRTVK